MTLKSFAHSDIGTSLTRAEWEATTAHEGGTGGPTLVVAASDALAKSKRYADYECDGTADDVEIQAAIDALPTGGGKVVLSEGTFTTPTSQGIKIPSNVALVGQGTSTIIQRSGNFSILITNSDFVGGNTNIYVGHMLVDGVTVGTGKPGGGGSIYFGKVTDGLIEDVRVVNSWNHGIELSRCVRVTIRKARVSGAGDDGFSLSDSQLPAGATGVSETRDIYIEDSHVDATDLEDSGVEVDDGPQRVYFRRCVLDGANMNFHIHAGEVAATDLWVEGCTFTGRTNLNISGNPAHTAGTGRVYVLGNVFNEGNLRVNRSGPVLIANNFFTFQRINGPTGNDYGITAERQADGIRIVNNHFTTMSFNDIIFTGGADIQDALIQGNYFINSTREPIRIDALATFTVKHLQIVDNILIGKPTDRGLSLLLDANTGTISDFLIKNNTVIDPGGGLTFGIRIRTRVGGVIQHGLVVGNSLRGATSGVELLNAGTMTNVLVRDNLGYVTENSGTATILSGNTSITITHGLDVTPTIDDISVILGESPTNDPGNTWVDTITSTQFNFNCRNDPGVSNLDLGWKAIVL